MSDKLNIHVNGPHRVDLRRRVTIGPSARVFLDIIALVNLDIDFGIVPKPILTRHETKRGIVGQFFKLHRVTPLKTMENGLQIVGFEDVTEVTIFIALGKDEAESAIDSHRGLVRTRGIVNPDTD
jgi:hypothetical protein